MKPLEPNDPHELVGVAFVEGDADLMAECLVEEYMLLGWNDRQLMLLFTRPCFRATHRIYEREGEAYVRAMIERVGARWRRAETCGEEGDA